MMKILALASFLLACMAADDCASSDDSQVLLQVHKAQENATIDIKMNYRTCSSSDGHYCLDKKCWGTGTNDYPSKDQDLITREQCPECKDKCESCMCSQSSIEGKGPVYCKIKDCHPDPNDKSKCCIKVPENCNAIQDGAECLAAGCTYHLQNYGSSCK